MHNIILSLLCYAAKIDGLASCSPSMLSMQISFSSLHRDFVALVIYEDFSRWNEIFIDGEGGRYDEAFEEA
jgi:hypothetical protein